jgi:hypothetical protein
MSSILYPCQTFARIPTTEGGGETVTYPKQRVLHPCDPGKDRHREPGEKGTPWGIWNSVTFTEGGWGLKPSRPSTHTPRNSDYSIRRATNQRVVQWKNHSDVRRGNPHEGGEPGSRQKGEGSQPVTSHRQKRKETFVLFFCEATILQRNYNAFQTLSKRYRNGPLATKRFWNSTETVHFQRNDSLQQIEMGCETFREKRYENYFATVLQWYLQLETIYSFQESIEGKR